MAMMSHREPNKVLWQGVRPAHNGTQVLENARVTNDTVVLYTVPADKVFYFCGFVAEYNWAAAAAIAYCEITTGVPALWWRFSRLRSQVATGQLSTPKSFWPPIEVPTEYIIQGYAANANIILNLSIHGWIEDA